mmetsp:Transcript_45616/g.105885  ORF Transcript_45616/g.105885 Transcript_45616/m.105885 type:complete len:551 (-) Transcript_45616:204-1856(-)
MGNRASTGSQPNEQARIAASSSQTVPAGSSQPNEQAGIAATVPASLTGSSDVQVSVLLGREKALVGVRQSVHVLLQIRTAEASHGRLPLHVSCVMDRSGSMNGKKLKFAKRGIRKLIKHLTPEDKLHLITYDDHVRQDFVNGDLTAEGKEGLVEKVKSVKVGGTTNLCGGLDAGADELLKDRATQGVGSRRVCLFSDGLVNKGVTDHAAILEHVRARQAEGVTFETFGIGTGFDEELMRSIAVEGKGEFAFLETAQSIPRLVSKSVHGLLTLAGTEAALHVRGLNGAVVTKVLGCGDDEDDEDDDMDTGAVGLMGLLRIGDLHTNNVKQVLVELELSPADRPEGQEAEALPVLEFGLRYKPCAGEQAASEAVSNPADLRSLEGIASISFTQDSSAVGAVNPEVAAAVAIQEAVAKEDRIVDLLQRGNKDEAIALKESAIAEVSRVHDELKDGAAPQAVCNQLEKALTRFRKALEGMRAEGRDQRAVLMEMRYERDIQERMSLRAYSEGADSDSWSSSSGGDADMGPAARRRQGSFNPQDSDADSTTSDSD